MWKKSANGGHERKCDVEQESEAEDAPT